MNKAPNPMGKHHNLGGFPASRMLIYSYTQFISQTQQRFSGVKKNMVQNLWSRFESNR